MVSGVCIVFTRDQRGITRKGAENQDTGLYIGNRFQSFLMYIHRVIMAVVYKAPCHSEVQHLVPSPDRLMSGGL